MKSKQITFNGNLYWDLVTIHGLTPDEALDCIQENSNNTHYIELPYKVWAHWRGIDENL